MKLSINLRSALCAFITGLLSSIFLPLPATPLLIMTIGLMVLLLIVLLFIKERWQQSCIIVTTLLLIGFLAGCFHAKLLQKQWLPEELQGRNLTVNGVISGLPTTSVSLTRFQFAPESALFDQEVPGKLWLSWYRAPDLQSGQQWQLQVRVRHPRGSYSKGAFDREAWAAREGVNATGYVREGRLISEAGGFSVDKVRLSVRSWLEQNTSPDTAAILSAILIGDKSGLSQLQWQRFNITGTTHLMVISGLHIGMMAALGFWLVFILARTGLLPLRVVSLPVMAAILSFFLAFGYALLAGFNIPVQRALIMTSVVLAGPLLGIKARPSTLYLLAMAIVLLIEPLAATSAGFWYSFAAVAILLYGCCGRIRNHGQTVAEWLRPQVWVFFMLSPLLMHNQQAVNLLSPLVNLIAIPTLGLVILPLTFIALLFHSFSSSLSQLLLRLLELMLSGWGQFLEWLADHSLILPLISCEPWQLLFVAVAVFVILSSKSLGFRWLAPFLLLPWLMPARVLPEAGDAKISVLDVGQGLSILIQTRQHALLYDTGAASKGRFSQASSTIIPYISREQIKQLDLVVISHGDEDHSGGLSALTERFTQVAVMAGSPVGAYEGQVSSCRKSNRWQWDGVDFEVLSGSEQGLKTNDRSCVIKVTAANGKSMLLTGDISEKKEAQLLAGGLVSPADFLLLPHHGSKYSGSDAFLSQIGASQVLVSAGFGNRFGHPSIETIDRVNSTGASVKNTAKSGTLSFILGAGFDGVQSYRQQNSPYWWR